MTTRSGIVIEYRAFFTQKRGNEPRHYEDAFALDGVDHAIIENVPHLEEKRGRVDPQGKPWRCAVADGATQGGFSKLWAQMLVDHFIYHPNSRRGKPVLEPSFMPVREWLKDRSYMWSSETINQILSTVPANSPRRSRIQQTLLLEGQAATLAMLELDVTQQRWKACIIGDSLVFHCDAHSGEINPIRPAPDMTWAQLDTNPILISSKENNQDAWIWDSRHFRRNEMFAEADFQPGDYFLLMTDALAKWFLRAIGSGDRHLYQQALRTLFAMQSNQEFVDWVERCRSLPTDDPDHIGNDDMTLVLISPIIANASAPPVQPIPVREVPVARTQTQEVQVAAPSSQDEPPVDPHSSPTIVHRPVQDDPNDPYPSDAPTVPHTPVNPADYPDAEGDEQRFRPVITQPSIDMLTGSNRPMTLPETTILMKSSTQQPDTKLPSKTVSGFGPIENIMDEPLNVPVDEWVDEIIRLATDTNTDEKKVRDYVQKGYAQYMDYINKHGHHNETYRYVIDLYNKSMELPRFIAFIKLDRIYFYMSKAFKSHKEPTDARLRTSKDTIDKINAEYLAQWRTRNENERRKEFLDLLKKQNRKRLKEFFINNEDRT